MHVAIVGAGLFGRLLALNLSGSEKSAKTQVTLFERDNLLAPRSAGYTAAAMLAPMAEAFSASRLITRLGCDSMPLWAPLLNRLPEPVFFQQAGSLVVSHPQDRGDYLNFMNHLQRNLEGTGLSEKLTRCDAQQLHTLEPELPELFQLGVLLQAEGQLDNRALYQASARAIEESQIQCRMNTEVDRIENNRVFFGNQSQDFDWVIDCRGLGAHGAAPGNLAQLRGVRGEVIRLHAPEVNFSRPIRLMHPRYPIYIVPKPNQEYVIGATEIESHDDSNISVRSTLELLSAAYSLHPGFAEARILETQTSCRPALPDNDPVIGIGRQLLQVNGLYRHGYLITPALLQEVIDTLHSAASVTERKLASRYPELYREAA
ncbi:MAG: FAD-dependent oxidoreductase [Pseudomonadales bacterium]